MNYAKYDLESSSDLEVFEFVSKGPQGEIIKTVQFSPTPTPNLFNLGFGDKRTDGSLDDASISKNGDMEKVLATVAAAVCEYTSGYPERNIIFSGSSLSRTRLYRMAISINYIELSRDFHIFGVAETNNKLSKADFERGYNYVAFIVTRKFINPFE